MGTEVREFFIHLFRLVYFKVVAVAVVMTAAASCTTTRQVTTQDIAKSNEREVYYNVTVVRDTLIQKDSVFQYVNGDTVRIEKWHNIYNPVYRLQTVTDTVCKTDTVIQYQTITTPSASQTPSFWQRLKSWVLAFMVAGVIAFVLLQLTRYINRK